MAWTIPVGGTKERKLAELILYISQKCVLDPNFGSVKLNKILYFSDYLSFGHRGKAITGVKYQHLEQGPAPNALVPVRNQMIEKSELKMETRITFLGYPQKRTIALRDPDKSTFDDGDLDVVDQVIEALSERTATEASNISHREVGWLTTKMHEDIPYASIFLSDEPLSPAEVRYAQSEWKNMMKGLETEAGAQLGL